MKDPAKRQEGKERLRAVDKDVRNLMDEVRRAELNLNHAHAGKSRGLGGWVVVVMWVRGGKVDGKC